MAYASKGERVKGAAKGAVGGGVGGAMLGGLIGSLFGPVGTIIGAKIGASIGGAAMATTGAVNPNDENVNKGFEGALHHISHELRHSATHKK